MRAWRIEGALGIDNLRLVEEAEPRPSANQVVVAMKAASLNYRDLVTVEGVPGSRAPAKLVPFSDGAGVIEAVGTSVTDLAPGDRVAPLFFQSWNDGPVSAQSRAWTLGGTLDGVLQERMALASHGVIGIPDSLSFEEAATLPCAGLTAWRAVVVEAPVGPGDTVLVEGTGGVSIFALQFAKARGAKVIVTSSSDGKLERAKRLGADHGINYRATPNWGKAVRDLTNGRGVDVVVEVGGEKTLSEALDATRVGGSIVVIGVLSGFTNAIALPVLFGKNLRLIGISVGSRAQFADMLKAIAAWKLKPVVDEVFAFDEVPAALKAMRAGSHFGKLCVRF